MIAVDTNIIVRLIVEDNPSQVERALALAEREPFFVSLTVLVETDWVLRSRYQFDRRRIVAALVGLTHLVDLRFEQGEWVRWALERYARGGELADYAHMIAALGVGRFASFEDKLAQRAGVQPPVTIEQP